MTNYRAIVLAINFFLFKSTAFVIPTRRAATMIGYHPFITSSRYQKPGSSFSKNRTSQLEEKLPSDINDAQPSNSILRRQVEAALAPISSFLDDVSDGWALSYADLTPNSERTLPGQVFLATNIAYTAVGLYLSLKGEVLLGTFTEVCSFASFNYHYEQLRQPYGRTEDSAVRLALLVDYILAVTSILIGLFYLVFDQAVPPPEGIAIAILGIICLLSCWVWEQGLPYIILHGLWHIFSAASAYYIGIAHVASKF